VALTTGLAVLAAAPASAKAPDVAAWWSQANVGNGAPAPPAPPDVHSGDLFVEGSNAAPATSGLGAAPSSSQAVAGLSFTLPSGAQATSLTLHIDGSPPPQTSVTACSATSSFGSESNGPYTDVPTYTCNQTAAAKLKGDTLVFPDIGNLASLGSLSLVLLPGPLDRVVLKKPTGSALSVTGGVKAPPPLKTGSSPPPGAGIPSSGSAGGAGSGAAGPTGGSGTGAGSGGAVPSLPGSATSGGTGGTGGQAPLVAPNPKAGAGSTGVPARHNAAATSVVGSSSAWRRIVAGALVALEIAAFAVAQRGRRATPAAVGAVMTLGGRLRPPDTVTAATSAVRQRGVGRFTGLRDHAAPRL
jgi:hypothetical protein